MKKYKKQLLHLLTIVIVMLAACSEEKVIDEKEIFTVSFVVDGEIVDKQQIIKDELVKRIEDPVGPNLFIGWFMQVDEYLTEYNFDSPVRKDITLYAEWENSGFSVKYIFNKEEIDDVVIRVPKGGKAPLLQMKLEEEELEKWCIDIDLLYEYDLSEVTSSFVLYAKWKSLIVEPEGPIVLIAECEDGELGNGAELSDGNGAASNGKAVDIRGGGNVKMMVDVPKEGTYQVSITYLTWTNGADKPSKINKVEIPGVLPQTDIDFVGTDNFETIDVGIYHFSKGTAEIILSASWGWTIFDKVTLTEKILPAEISAEFEDGELNNGAYLENVQGGASGGNAVCLAGGGNVSVKLITPKTASYKILVKYFGWAGQTKRNYIEIPGILPKQDYEFVGNNNYQDLTVGIVDLTEGQEITIVASAFWGWTYVDKVTLIEVEKPKSVIIECEEGELSNDAKLETPKDGASNDNAVNICQNGKVKLKVTIPKNATYKFTIRYFTWQADKKLNKVSIPGILPETEYNFIGTNNYENLHIADLELSAGEIEVELSASWGWTYFDKIMFEEIIL